MTSNWSREKYLAYWREYRKARREQVKAKGFCVVCLKRLALPGKSYCQECLDRNNHHQKKRRRNIPKGTCTKCKKRPATTGYKTCEECRAYNREAKRKHDARRRSGNTEADIACTEVDWE